MFMNNYERFPASWTLWMLHLYRGTSTYENSIKRKILNMKRASKKFPSNITKKTFKIQKSKVPLDSDHPELNQNKQKAVIGWLV